MQKISTISGSYQSLSDLSHGLVFRYGFTVRNPTRGTTLFSLEFSLYSFLFSSLVFFLFLLSFSDFFPFLFFSSLFFSSLPLLFHLFSLVFFTISSIHFFYFLFFPFLFFFSSLFFSFLFFSFLFFSSCFKFVLNIFFSFGLLYSCR